ncbi:hypothetical protein ANN_03463 [Periplaneta americana]|uniref:Transposase n=1 Tax=Periplaneta americana TaxID=6978 RepID=A0ABQ8TZ16_PERAM|nr:hypothetical protein ANN_03463 [Periplaneta americana]
MATVFRDQERILLVDWFPPNTTINSDRYCTSLHQLRRRIQQGRHGKWGRDVLLQQDNPRPHATIRELGFTVLPHPLNSPDLAHSDYALFDSMKEGMRGKKLTTNDELHAVVQQWRRDTPKEWFVTFWQLPYLRISGERIPLDLHCTVAPTVGISPHASVSAQW